MAYRPLPPVEYLRQIIDYNPDTGEAFWLKRTANEYNNNRQCLVFNSQYVGKRADCLAKNGYRRITINNIRYWFHRVVWALVTGSDPLEKQIDHINRDRSDNRVINLRLATHANNNANTIARNNNKSATKGVCFHKPSRKYMAYITVNYRRYHLGLYDTVDEAAKAYAKAANLHYGEFARAS